jgi:hypothetical protein
VCACKCVLWILRIAMQPVSTRLLPEVFAAGGLSTGHQSGPGIHRVAPLIHRHSKLAATHLYRRFQPRRLYEYEFAGRRVGNYGTSAGWSTLAYKMVSRCDACHDASCINTWLRVVVMAPRP